MWRPKAQGYLFSKDFMEEGYVAWCLNEVHVPTGKEPDIKAAFGKHWFLVNLNPTYHTGNGGTHGGELIAIPKHIESGLVDKDIINAVISFTNEPLRMSVSTLRLSLEGVTSTLYGTSDRVIDLVLVSYCIRSLVKKVAPVLDSPCRPHLSFGVKLFARPRQLRAWIQIKPKPIPMEKVGKSIMN